MADGVHSSSLCLSRWLEQHGGFMADQIHISGEPRGLYANAPIVAGDLLLSVPSALLLTAGAAAGDKSLAEADALIMMLLQERSRGAASRLSPWIQTLPDRRSFESSLPLLWDEARAAALLRCPVAIERLRAQRASVRARFAALGTSPRADGSVRPSWHDYLWAWACVESRTFHARDGVDGVEEERSCIVPVADMLNHDASQVGGRAWEVGRRAYEEVPRKPTRSG